MYSKLTSKRLIPCCTLLNTPNSSWRVWARWHQQETHASCLSLKYAKNTDYSTEKQAGTPGSKSKSTYFLLQRPPVSGDQHEGLKNMRKCQVIYLSAGVTVLYVSASLYTQYAVHEIVRKCMHEQISTLVNTTHHSHVDFGSGSEGHPHTHTKLKIWAMCIKVTGCRFCLWLNCRFVHCSVIIWLYSHLSTHTQVSSGCHQACSRTYLIYKLFKISQ